MRILIADENVALLEIMRSYLRDRGDEAEIATNGLECIAKLREFIPDVLVLERSLLWGGSDGVLAVMRSDYRLSRIPVILTAEDGNEFGDLGISNTMAWLQKPFRMSDLATRIASAIRAGRLEETSCSKEH